jgi:hypothetical protein
MAIVLFLQLLFPSIPAPAAATDEAADGMRYRGIEAMFAEFESEPGSDE